MACAKIKEHILLFEKKVSFTPHKEVKITQTKEEGRRREKQKLYQIWKQG